MQPVISYSLLLQESLHEHAAAAVEHRSKTETNHNNKVIFVRFAHVVKNI
jgi:hypothetical protein